MNHKTLPLLAILLAVGAAEVFSAEEKVKQNAASVVKKPMWPLLLPITTVKGADIVNAKCIECHGTGKHNSPRTATRLRGWLRPTKGLMQWFLPQSVVTTKCRHGADCQNLPTPNSEVQSSTCSPKA